jgi:hypothetical protein
MIIDALSRLGQARFLQAQLISVDKIGVTISKNS